MIELPGRDTSILNLVRKEMVLRLCVVMTRAVGA